MIAIIGAGGHAKCVYECFYLQGMAVTGFFDDDPTKLDLELIDGKKVLGKPSDIEKCNEIDAIFVAIGDNRRRMNMYTYFKEKGFMLPNALHREVYQSPFAVIGEGNFAMGRAVINPSSRIGNYCIINTSATVGHDCFLEDGVQIGPGVNLAGGSLLGEGVFVGIGAKVAPGVKIGSWTVIGAGAVVLEDVPGGVFCCGVPAGVIKQN